MSGILYYNVSRCARSTNSLFLDLNNFVDPLKIITWSPCGFWLFCNFLCILLSTDRTLVQSSWGEEWLIMDTGDLSTLSVVPRPFKRRRKGPGTYCTRMCQLPQENLGCHKQLYAFLPSFHSLGYKATPI